jgi:hypothetical protein
VRAVAEFWAANEKRQVYRKPGRKKYRRDFKELGDDRLDWASYGEEIKPVIRFVYKARRCQSLQQ